MKEKQTPILRTPLHQHRRPPPLLHSCNRLAPVHSKLLPLVTLSLALSVLSSVRLQAAATDHLLANETQLGPAEITSEERSLPALSALRAAYRGRFAAQSIEESIQAAALRHCEAAGFEQVESFATLEDRTQPPVTSFYLAASGFPRQDAAVTSAFCGGLTLLGTLAKSAALHAHSSTLSFVPLWPLAALAMTAAAAYVAHPELAFQEPSLDPRWLERDLKQLNSHVTPWFAHPHYPRDFAHLKCGDNPETQALLRTFLGNPKLPEAPSLLAHYRQIPALQKKEFLQFFQTLKPNDQSEMRSRPPEFWRLFATVPTFLPHLKALTTSLEHFSNNSQKLTQYFLTSPAREPRDPAARRADPLLPDAPPPRLRRRFLTDPVSVCARFPPHFQLSALIPAMETQLLLQQAAQLPNIEALDPLLTAYRKTCLRGRGTPWLGRKRQLALEQAAQQLTLRTLSARVAALPDPYSAAPASSTSSASRVLLLPPTTTTTTTPSPATSTVCSICLTEQAVVQGPAACRCFDYCASCAKDQLQQANARTGAVARCLAPACRRPIEAAFFEQAAVGSSPERERFKRQQLAATARERLPQWRACQTLDCCYGTQTLPQQAFDQHFACPACQQNRCLECAQSHPGRSCTGDLDPSLQRLLAKGRHPRVEPRPHPLSATFDYGMNRPCPHCGKVAGREDGCNNVKCSECRKNFHWNLGALTRIPHDYANLAQAYPLRPGIHPHF